MLGTTIWFAESLETLPDALRAARPHHFLAVPRVWEKMQAKMEAVGAKNSPLKKRIAAWARGVGLAAGYADQRGRRAAGAVSASRTDWCSRRSARRSGSIARETLVTGAAPISSRTLEFFLSLGLPICEVYGMSETTAVTHGVARHGGIAPARPASCCREPRCGSPTTARSAFADRTSSKGIYKDPDATREAIDADGWLHSGDVGEFDAEGFLRITDRKKELIITAGGENIAPQFVEGQLKSIGVVSQAVVIGDRQRYLAVLLTLDPEKISAWRRSPAARRETPRRRRAASTFAAHLQREIDGVNQRLARVQTVKRFAILPDRAVDRRRRAHADDEAQAKGDLAEVRRGDREVYSGDLTGRSRNSNACPGVCANRPRHASARAP